MQYSSDDEELTPRPPGQRSPQAQFQVGNRRPSPGSNSAPIVAEPFFRTDSHHLRTSSSIAYFNEPFDHGHTGAVTDVRTSPGAPLVVSGTRIAPPSQGRNPEVPPTRQRNVDAGHGPPLVVSGTRIAPPPQARNREVTPPTLRPNFDPGRPLVVSGTRIAPPPQVRRQEFPPAYQPGFDGPLPLVDPPPRRSHPAFANSAPDGVGLGIQFNSPPDQEDWEETDDPAHGESASCLLPNLVSSRTTTPGVYKKVIVVITCELKDGLAVLIRKEEGPSADLFPCGLSTMPPELTAHNILTKLFGASEVPKEKGSPSSNFQWCMWATLVVGQGRSLQSWDRRHIVECYRSGPKAEKYSLVQV
ncbi:hypothetical protein T439DRAFT_359918 [Meredithblackwellia eburnea MCA 4105]